MKKTILLIALLVYSLSFSQINTKNIQTWSEANNTIITNTNNSQLGGDEIVVWENDFSGDVEVDMTIENVGGYGDWIWSTESTQGQWGGNAGLIVLSYVTVSKGSTFIVPVIVAALHEFKFIKDVTV